MKEKNSGKLYYSKILKANCAISGIWLFILMLAIVRDVLGRNFFGAPLMGTPELVGVSIPIIAFLQIPYALMTDKHVSTGFLLNRFSKTLKLISLTSCYIAGFLTFCFVSFALSRLLYNSIITNHYEGFILRVPSALIILLLLLGALLTGIEYIRKTYVMYCSKN